MTTETTRGDFLATSEQQRAKKLYANRHTKEHVPEWAKKPKTDGTRYMPQFATDAEWLRKTHFPTKKGRIVRGDCTSSPTWPDGKSGL